MLLVALVGGAIVNVAVAWGCAGFSTQPQRATTSAWRAPATRTDVAWQVDQYQRWGVVRVVAFPQAPRHNRTLDVDAPGIYPAWSGLPEGLYDDWSPNGPVWMIVEGAGWPCFALRSTWHSDWLGAPVSNAGWSHAWGLPPGSVVRGGMTYGTPRALPLRPIWPGFAINTVFYAVILYGVFALPAALRRKRRLARGQCPKCAYPVGTSDKCTECGATIARATA